MTDRREPHRMCIGCRTRRPARELVRLSMHDGRLSTERTAGGRGAWICPDPTCRDTAVSRRALARALRLSPTPELADALRELPSGASVFPPGPQS